MAIRETLAQLKQDLEDLIVSGRKNRAFHVRQMFTNTFDTFHAWVFPFVPATVSMNAIPPREKNRISAITVSGAISPNDETVFTTRRLLKGGVAWQIFTGNNYSFNDSISDTTTYRVEVGVGNNGTPTTIFATRTVEFILPWFCGASDTDVITAAMIYAGTKNVAAVGGSIVANFGAGAKFLWFAVPKGSKTFSSWYRTPLDQGAIGGGTNLFKSRVEISVSSTGITNAQGQPNNWTADYDLYVTNYKTEASTATTLS